MDLHVLLGQRRESQPCPGSLEGKGGDDGSQRFRGYILDVVLSPHSADNAIHLRLSFHQRINNAVK